ncbi:MAG: Glucose-6-phosphate isomerase [Acidimicrobiaceae bacterium]|nr:Glucose-6-phosphate isomerase [Acidimicrobiaceae bacterium]
MSTDSGSLEPEDLYRRLLARDATLWPEGNVSANRLGWLDSPRELERESKELTKWAETIDQDTVVLLGMGGSSLGPEVLASVRDSFGGSGRRVVVCDTTDPETVAAAPIEDAFMLVSSKSGTTLEPNVLFAHARSRVADPRRYAVITDPGTPLAAEAEEIGVGRLFQNRPDIGGRYSVLSYFGLVPAVLAGYDIGELCGRVLEVDGEDAVRLGLEMGRAALEGRDKATLVVPEVQRALGLWLEQLIAESTGKQGTGCVPVPTSEQERGEDRHLIDVSLTSAHELGETFYRFELATAAAGHALGIDPFDEPNVAESKANTNRVLENLPLPEVPTSEPGALWDYLEETVQPRDYVSLQAYLPYGSEAKLEQLRHKVRDRFGGMAVTAGYGPRFLHSTGQLHKGGPNEVVAVQLVRRSPAPQLPIPGKPYDFATLISAQAIGDLQSLEAHGRRCSRVSLDDLSELL